jgi:3-oxoacyl-[acyl-carrier-protein] synthase-1
MKCRQRMSADCYLNHAAAICALGQDIDAIARRLFTASYCPLQMSDHYTPGRSLALGRVPKIPCSADTRTNALLASALAPLCPQVETYKQRFGASQIAVVLGSSTSGIAEGEAAIAHHMQTGIFPPEYQYAQQEIAAPSHFVAQSLGLRGPVWTISTACSSGAKALASAARLLRTGACDAVITGGTDSLCKLTVEGFCALASVSTDTCNPFSVNRHGINIGEAAALFIMTREPGLIRLAGYGETSDAYHISAPEPQGMGAEAAMRAALHSASLPTSAIQYINLHGTGTEHNDRMESYAVHRVFGSELPCSSTKPLTGHTLGASGALEAALCWLALQRTDAALPPHLWDGAVDPALAPLHQLGATHTRRALRYAMSNSFAFGGNNCSLIMERCDDR